MKDAVGLSYFDSEQFKRNLSSNSFKIDGKALREQVACPARKIPSSVGGFQ